MRQLFHKTKLVFSVLLATAFILLPAAPAQAALFEGSVQEACNGAALAGSGDCDNAKAKNDVQSAISEGLQIFSVVIGVIAVVMIIIGGFKYIISSGDPASVNGAKNTILYAVIGLVIAAFAQIIVQFVLVKFQDPPKKDPNSSLIKQN